MQLLADNQAIRWGRILQIRLVRNARQVYSLRQIRVGMIGMFLVACACAAILRHTGTWFQSQRALVGLGMAFGGALGNLSDVLRRKSVTDFIDLGWWPVFNIADVGIVGGLILAFWR